jgi:hypothetical protein
MPAKGECIILYSECNYKGSSFKYCNQPNEMLSFKLPILSVYVPIGYWKINVDNNLKWLMLSKEIKLTCYWVTIAFPSASISQNHNYNLPMMHQAG